MNCNFSWAEYCRIEQNNILYYMCINVLVMLKHLITSSRFNGVCIVYCITLSILVNATNRDFKKCTPSLTHIIQPVKFNDCVYILHNSAPRVLATSYKITLKKGTCPSLPIITLRFKIWNQIGHQRNYKCSLGEWWSCFNTFE